MFETVAFQKTMHIKRAGSGSVRMILDQHRKSKGLCGFGFPTLVAEMFIRGKITFLKIILFCKISYLISSLLNMWCKVITSCALLRLAAIVLETL